MDSGRVIGSLSSSFVSSSLRSTAEAVEAIFIDVGSSSNASPPPPGAAAAFGRRISPDVTESLPVAIDWGAAAANPVSASVMMDVNVWLCPWRMKTQRERGSDNQTKGER